MDGYLSQVRRSRSKVKVKVTRSKNVHWVIPLTSESLVTYMDLPKKKLRMTGRNTTKHMHFFVNTVDHFTTVNSCEMQEGWVS